MSAIHNLNTLDDPRLRDALKRCSPATYYAACKFRQTGEARDAASVVCGVLEHYVDRDLRPKLLHAAGPLLLREDLGIDSLSMMEALMIAEDVLCLPMSTESLTELRTVDDVQNFIASKIPPSGKAPSGAQT